MPALRLVIPTAPSVNSLYSNFRGKRKRSKAYDDWIVKARAMINLQRGDWITLNEECELSLYVEKVTKRIQDISNRVKATEDILVKSNILIDDSLVRKVTVEWVESVPLPDLEVDVRSKSGFTLVWVKGL